MHFASILAVLPNLIVRSLYRSLIMTIWAKYLTPGHAECLAMPYLSTGLKSCDVGLSVLMLQKGNWPAEP